MDPHDQRTWLPWLDASANRFVALLQDTPNEWLTRRIEMIDTPGRALSGWRLLMMMLEHEVHHRSQIDTYAGLEGWPVPDIFGRSAESINALQDAERAKHAAPSVVLTRRACAPPHPGPLPLRGRGYRSSSLSLGEGEGQGGARIRA